MEEKNLVFTNEGKLIEVDDAYLRENYTTNDVLFCAKRHEWLPVLDTKKVVWGSFRGSMDGRKYNNRTDFIKALREKIMFLRVCMVSADDQKNIRHISAIAHLYDVPIAYSADSKNCLDWRIAVDKSRCIANRRDLTEEDKEYGVVAMRNLESYIKDNLTIEENEGESNE